MVSERRPFELSELSPKEWMLLSTRAELMCVERLSALADRLAARDEALGAALAGMADDERSHLEHLNSFDADVPWPALLRVDERALAALLSTHLPTLCRGPRSDDPDEVKAYVRGIEKESSSFYRTLAARAQTPELAKFFERMAEAEEAHAGNLPDDG